MTRLSLLLALSCSDYASHSPDVGGYLSGDYCGRIPIATYTAGPNECVRLSDWEGETIFRFDTSESCGGPPCEVAYPGETLLALEKFKDHGMAEWTVERGSCEELGECCGFYLDEDQCW
jgi:hypothetical protein